MPAVVIAFCTAVIVLRRGSTIEAFSHRLPRKRFNGDGEDSRQSLFDAAASAISIRL